MKTIKNLNNYLFLVPIYSFTADELNEYTAKVIKQALETARDKVKLYDANEDCHYQDEAGNFPEEYVVNKESITNTFEETFNKFKV